MLKRVLHIIVALGLWFGVGTLGVGVGWRIGAVVAGAVAVHLFWKHFNNAPAMVQAREKAKRALEKIFPEHRQDTGEDDRTPRGADRRTQLAFALSVPAGLVIGWLVWQTNGPFGGPCVVTTIVPLCTAGLCVLATRRRILVGLSLCAAFAGAVAVFQWQKEYGYGFGGQPFNPVRPVGTFALVFVFSGVFSLLASVPLMYLRRRLRPAARRRPGLCPRCGYDLRASPGRCPECGAAPKKIPI